MTRFILLLVSLAEAALAQTAPRIERNIPYAEPRNERQLLDVYAPATGTNLPVVVWVHGGGWAVGNKEQVDHKPNAFIQKGYVFVAMNYRFVPVVDMGTIIRDVSKSVGWAYKNIKTYGGDPNRLLLMGHSAGAQLAAILCTDRRYIEADGVPHSAIKACVPVDGDTYDVPLQVATFTARRMSLNQPRPKMGHPEKFGTLQQQREYSAVNHVAPNRGIPPFLLLHVATHQDTSAQAYRLWQALDIAGIPAQIYGAEDTDHVKLDRNIGLPDDPSTKVMYEFLDKVSASR